MQLLWMTLTNQVVIVMKMKKIHVIGGGLAGLSAALCLSRKGHDVEVFEKKKYPCVKLCGEFLSPEGLSCLNRITEISSSVLEKELNLKPVRHFAWISRNGRTLKMTLSPGGWAVRRDRLDFWLASQASKAGAWVRFGERGAPVEGVKQLWATGKEHDGLKSNFFAVKGYAADSGFDMLEGRDVVLFQLHGGYIGFTRMHDGELSYCALLNRKLVLRNWRFTNWSDLQEGLFQTNPRLSLLTQSVRSASASHIGSARFDFQTRHPVREGIWYAGDAVQLVPPFVGDGMAMALEGGELAAGLLNAGASDSAYHAAWRKKFIGRIRLARILHPIFWSQRITEPCLTMMNLFPDFAPWIYSKTRDFYAA